MENNVETKVESKPVEAKKQTVIKPVETKKVEPVEAKQAVEAEPAKKDNKVVVTYVGNSVWQDSDGKYWARECKGATIKNERQYTQEEYDSHKDIKFMVEYGEMKATFIK